MKLKINAYLYIIIVALNFISCQQKNNLITKLTAIEKDSFFCFDSLYTEKQWDCIYILEPYADVDNININLNSNNKWDIHHALQSEGVCVIIFVDKNKYVSYQTITRNKIDFQLSDKARFDRNFVFYKDSTNIVKLKK